LIRAGQWLAGDGYADFEHAVLHVGDGQIVEAEPGGARLAPWDKYGDRARWSTGIVTLTDTQRLLIASAGRGYVGTPYSAADYLAIAAHRLRLPGSALLKGYVATSRHMICSQLVDRAHCDGGSHLFQDGRWEGYVTPGSLNHLLDARGRT
jgi:hypothetical protein